MEKLVDDPILGRERGGDIGGPVDELNLPGIWGKFLVLLFVGSHASWA